MTTTMGTAAHGAGSNHANADSPALPIEPLRRETPDEFRTRMDEKAAAQRRFVEGKKAASAATYAVSVEPRADDDPVADVDDDSEPSPTPSPAPSPRPAPRPAPPAVPARVPNERQQQTLAMVTAYMQGDTAEVIGGRYGISGFTVLKRLRAAGVEIRPRGGGPSAARITPAELQAMVTDYENGKSAPEIAEATGRTPKTVRTALQRAGVRMRDDRSLRSGGQNRRQDDPVLVDRVRRLYVDEGLTQAVVADRLNSTLKIVQGIMQRNGIEARPDAVGVKRDPAPAPERTVRYRHPATDAPSKPAPGLNPAPDGATPLAPEPTTANPDRGDLEAALAAAGATVAALVDAVDGLAAAVERVQAERMAAAARAIATIRRDTATLLAVLGDPIDPEGSPS